VFNDYTLASHLDRQFGDLPVGLRKILLSMIHERPRSDYLEARSSLSGRMSVGVQSDPTELAATQTASWPWGGVQEWPLFN